MFDWEIRKLYRDAIEEYQYKIGKNSYFGANITERFIKTLKKRLKELEIRKLNGLL